MNVIGLGSCATDEKQIIIAPGESADIYLYFGSCYDYTDTDDDFHNYDSCQHLIGTAEISVYYNR